MVRQTDGLTHSQTDRWMDGQTYRGKGVMYKQSVRQTDVQI